MGWFTAEMNGRLKKAGVTAALGGVIHVVLPLLFVLPQDPSGPTIGVPATTYGVMIIGATALVGAALLGLLPTPGRLLIVSAAMLSA